MKRIFTTAQPFFLTALIALGLGACSKSSSFSATAKLAMNNATGGLQRQLNKFNLQNNLQKSFGAFSTIEAATVFQVRLIAAYISEDTDENGDNVGATGIFYMNPACEDDIMHCDISGGTAEDGAPMDKVINDFFDWGADSGTVNAALNASSKGIETGTYRYVRLEFCKYNEGNARNFKYSWASNGGDPIEFQRNSCTINSAVMDPPLEVADGDEVTVNVAYDLSQAIHALDPNEPFTGNGECDSADSTQARHCLDIPQFVPSATK